MAFIPVPNVVELVASFRNSQTLALAKNVLNWKKRSGAPIASDLDVIAGYYATQWGATLNDEISNQISLIQTDLRDLSDENSFIEVNPIASPVTGGEASPVMPSNVTLAIKFTTGLAGRSFRGRLYVVGLPEVNVSGDFVTTAVGNQLVAAYQALIDGAFAATGYDLCVVSRYSNGSPRVTGIATVITTASLTDYRVDTQRRRLVGEGE